MTPHANSLPFTANYFVRIFLEFASTLLALQQHKAIIAQQLSIVSHSCSDVIRSLYEPHENIKFYGRRHRDLSSDLVCVGSISVEARPIDVKMKTSVPQGMAADDTLMQNRQQ